MTKNKEIVKTISDAIRKVVGSEKDVALHEPFFNGNEIKYLKKCVKTTYVSSVGKYVDDFENMLSDFTGAKFTVAVINGTSALQIALKLSGVKANNEVIVPALTFVGTVNAISYNNAIPHFVDNEEKTLGIDFNKLSEYLSTITFQKNGECINKKTGNIIRAIIPVHTFGHPVDIEKLIETANKFNIKIIEDAAESIGSYYKGKHTGTFGEFGVLSFNGNKSITTGNGGAILTNDSKLAKKAKHLTSTAKIPHKWEYIHDEIGYNYRMSNINAALGCAQLEQVSKIIEAKRKLYDQYLDVFSTIPEITLFKEPKNCKSNYWLQTIILNQKMYKFQKLILKEINNERINVRPPWNLVSDLDMYLSCPKMDLSCSRLLSQKLINIPSSPNIELSENE